MEEKIGKDCEVEVCSDEVGFEGAWFRGILEENPTKSGRKKLRVRYLTLLNGDGSSPLIENIEPKFIRPVPSEDRYTGVVLEQGSVVDADHRDGWWTGLVIEKLKDETFLVYFDSPPDIIHFQRNQLRPHLDWTGSEFFQPGIQELDKSMFSSGTMVEVSSMDVAWSPAMIIKEIEGDDEKKFIVKNFNNHLASNGDDARPNSIVDLCRVRPVPPPFSVEDYNLMDCVEVCRGGWYQGLVRGVLSENRYVVCLETTKEEHVFPHSELRPFKVWEGGVWRDGPKFQAKPVKETPSNVTKTKPMRSCSGAKPRTPKRATRHTIRFLNLEGSGETLSEAETADATGELRKKRSADVVMNDKTPPVITPQMKSNAKESVTPVTPSPVRSASPLKRTKSDTQGKTSPKKPMRNKNDLKNDSTQEKMSEEKKSEEKSKKRKREEKHKSDPKETDGTCNGNAEINDTSNKICNDDDVDDQPLSAWIKIKPTELSLDQSPIVGSNAAAGTDVEETQAKDTLMALPFAKKSPFWKTYETHEVCRTVPQSPHFSPLFEAKKDFREWAAVGMMVTFYGLLEEVKDLQLDASSSKLSSLGCSFDELEKHGFDVATPLSRINKILSLQDAKAKKEEERKCVEKKIEAEEIERERFEEEMVELQRKILELKRQQLVVKEKMEVADKRMVEMISYAETIDQEIEELEIEFKTSPW
ncbi:DUF724 domain-containing protein 6 [Cardamine amara subsp. amara]|uniref:DUF724 domain-containing protein 6 n=1 Tax=Cardamine amara subsp. amara TaxID=228776 RepID=A0ABD0ZRP6_CARAN